MSGASLITVQGIGWIGENACGGIRSGWRKDAPAGGVDEQFIRGLFSQPVKNWGRFDSITRMTCAVVALALRDAGIAGAPFQKLDIGIVGTAPAGSLAADVEYFRDYLDGGRTLSRGNLFIYTLPSSPLGEAAIHFGLQGPLLYCADHDDAPTAVLRTGGEMLAAGETGRVLAGTVGRGEAVYFLLASGEQATGGICSLADAMAITDGKVGTRELVRTFSACRPRKGDV